MALSSLASRLELAGEPDFLRLLLGVLRRRKLVVAATFLLVAVPLLAWSLYGARDQYRSSATLQIRPSIADMLPAARDLPVRSDMSVQMAVLRSRALAGQVLDSLPPDTVAELIGENLRSDYLFRFTNAARGLLGLPPVASVARQRAMNELQRSRMKFNVLATDGPGGGLVEISATAFTPRVAYDIASTYIGVLEDWSKRTEAEDAAAARQFLESRLSQVREEEARSRAAARRTGARREAPARRAATGVDAASLRARLAELERLLLEMTARYTEDHPSVVALRQELAGLRAELAALPGRDPRAGRAAPAADTDEARQALEKFLSDKLLALRSREQSAGSDVRLIDPPQLPGGPAEPVSPARLALVLAFALGLAGGLATLIEFLADPVDSEQVIRGRLGLRFLGSALDLPSRGPLGAGPAALARRLARGPWPARGLLPAPAAGPAASPGNLPLEFYRGIRGSLEALPMPGPGRAIMVTSACPGEGKSTTAMHLAATLGELGHRVCLIDADLRRPSLSAALGADASPGLTGLLQAAGPPQAEPGPAPGRGFAFVPAGEPADDPGALLVPARVEPLVEWLKQRWDYVIFDSPPSLLVSDNLPLAAALDGVVLVARSGRTPSGDLAKLRDLLEARGARVLGVVLNQVPARQLPYYRHYRRYREAMARAPGARA